MSSRTASSALSGSGHTCARHQTLNPGAALFRGKLDTRTWRRVQGLEPRGGGHTVSGAPPLQFTTILDRPPRPHHNPPTARRGRRLVQRRFWPDQLAPLRPRGGHLQLQLDHDAHLKVFRIQSHSHFRNRGTKINLLLNFIKWMTESAKPSATKPCVHLGRVLRGRRAA